jgi:uracil-DNA glycosylase family 4
MTNSRAESVGTDGRCENCPNNPVRAVAAHGASPARVLMLAGAPRHHDEVNGRAFISPLFAWLLETLASAGIAPDAVHYATLVACRPPHQRPLREDEVSACASRLEALLDDVRPKVIVLCGADALSAMMPGATLAMTHGRAFSLGERLYVPIRHPYTTLHHEPYLEELREDLRAIAAMLADGSPGAVATAYVAASAAVSTVQVPEAPEALEGIGTLPASAVASGTDVAAVEPPLQAVAAEAIESDSGDGETVGEEPAEETVSPAQLSLF